MWLAMRLKEKLLFGRLAKKWGWYFNGNNFKDSIWTPQNCLTSLLKKKLQKSTMHKEFFRMPNFLILDFFSSSSVVSKNTFHDDSSSPCDHIAQHRGIISREITSLGHKYKDGRFSMHTHRRGKLMYCLYFYTLSTIWYHEIFFLLSVNPPRYRTS